MDMKAAACFAAVSLLMTFSPTVGGQGSPPPNIIFILADDMGWNDVSFHGSDQIATPNLDALAYHGVILNSHYVQPLCTPSRAALLTGKYPIRTGMQGVPIEEHEARGLPAGTLLPGYLKDLGYVTRAVGKWHLGFHKRELTPTYRGFDSHFGYWGGSIGYNDYIIQVQTDEKDLNGYMLRHNMTTVWDYPGGYATDVFAAEAQRLILEHDTSVPLFLYLAHQACHAGTAASSIVAPPEAVSRFGYISDPNRRIYAGIVSKLDDSVGHVVTALHQRGMLGNSIIVFTSDNGAPTTGKTSNWGSNYPFRGLKATLWEGGVRSAALLWSPLLQETPRVSSQLMHVTDWLTTLYSAAGGDATNLPESLDGVDLWEALVTSGESPRTEALLNVDEEVGNAAVRVGDWKLVRGVQNNANDVGYFGSSGAEDPLYTPAWSPEQVLSSPAGEAVSAVLGGSTPTEDMLRLRVQATVTCPDRPQSPLCVPRDQTDLCIFNIAEDPCEAGDAAVSAGVLDMLLRRLEALSEPMEPQQNLTKEPDRADPARWNNTWVPWTDCLADTADAACNFIGDNAHSSGANNVLPPVAVLIFTIVVLLHTPL